ncbi:MAG: cupin domain-containing protein [Ilumatobacteraceae bacterium]
MARRLRWLIGQPNWSHNDLDDNAVSARGCPREADERFAALAACFDRNTFATLTSIGIAGGWRCWEVGAGGASVPTWLAGRVGATGTVVATDIDIAHLSPAPPGVDVREHDVAADHAPREAFDLVHARLLLTHVPERRRALRAMADALSPGGWLVIEDFDVAMGPAACLDPQSADERRANKMRAAFITLLAERGVDLTFGRDLPRELRSLGLVDVRAEAHFPISDPATRALERANTRQVADALVAGGHATTAEIDDHLAALDHLDIATPPLVTVRARRPERDECTSRVATIDDTMATSSRVVTVRPEAGTLERDRLDAFVGVSERTAGARSISMQLVIVPPGARATAHFHPLHETVIYVLGGRVEVESGPNLEHCHLCQTGDFVLTPAGVVHAPRNLSTTEPAYLIAARTDPSEHEQTVQAPS